MKGRDGEERTRVSITLSMRPDAPLADPPQLIMAMRQTIAEQAIPDQIGPVTVCLRIVPTRAGSLLVLMAEAFKL